MLRDPNCQLCCLSNYCATACLQGRGNPDTASLLVLTDQPSWQDDMRGKSFVSDSAELLMILFGRMSVNVETDVWLDYIVKCSGGKKMPKAKADRLVCYEACSHYRFATLQNLPNVKACVVMGKIALEALNGSSEVGKFEGECWTPRELPMRNRFPQVWVTYSPAYLIERPAEIPNIYRVLYVAAKQAGLNPRPNLNAPHFDWSRF